MSPNTENHEPARELSVAEMRADLEAAGYADALARFMKHYPSISEQEAITLFHSFY